ncbi:hypothetical protein GDO81_004259 [Engystomops pustulosus]|uniref:Uncharacterized protein n=1 Tax=Engystomops pustulosus TaxID=76066 RepID=A0AAV6ZRA6_ENGPU|nr:hypothetical protein GDO81_004259 [Engystomops pustulosus]
MSDGGKNFASLCQWLHSANTSGAVCTLKTKSGNICDTRQCCVSVKDVFHAHLQEITIPTLHSLKAATITCSCQVFTQVSGRMGIPPLYHSDFLGHSTGFL